MYVTLIPVCAGIAMASVSELSFTWKAFATAVISAVSGSLRGIYSKEKLKDTRGRNLEAQNLCRWRLLLQVSLVASILTGFRLLVRFCPDHHLVHPSASCGRPC